MKSKIKWAVIVGKPKMSFWKTMPSKPNLSYVGMWVSGWTDDNRWSRDPILYNTRKEARIRAKILNLDNKAWHYHAKKYTP